MVSANRILVVDDEPIVCNSCRKTFEEEGYEVETALSGREGLKKARQGDFDVVVSDLKIPDINGIEVLERLKQEQPHIPVVIITGYASPETDTEAMKIGAFDYIAKPFSPDQLTDVVRKAIEKRRALSEAPDEERLMHALSQAEIKVDDRAAPAIASTITSVGVKKALMPFFNLVILGMLAGVYIGFGAALATLVGHDSAKYVGLGWSQLMNGAVFSVGLMLVVIAGAELFTGNSLMITSVLGGQMKIGKLMEKWGIVYLANFLGSMVLVYIMYASGLWKTGNLGVGAKALAIANGKVNLGFTEALFRGIGCNWLVCLAVWMAASARQTVGKIFAIFFPIMAFVALGFEHSVANMYFIPMGLLLKGTEVLAESNLTVTNLTWGNFAAKNLFPVTIGNIIGGAIFVGAFYWSVYVKGQPKPHRIAST